MAMETMKESCGHQTVRMRRVVVALLAAVAAAAAACVDEQACQRRGTDCDCRGGGGGGAETLCFSAGLAFCTSLRADGRVFSDAPDAPFAALPRLTSLSLRGCGLRRLPASALAALPRLRTLHLSRNPLADDDLAFLRHATGLRDLRLDYCNISAVPTRALQQYTALEHLSLAGNRLSSVDAALFDDLSALQRLDLSRNQLARFHLHASALPSLALLNLSHNALADVQFLAGNQSNVDEDSRRFRNELFTLDLSHNTLSGNLAFLRDVPRLKLLNLSSCRILNIPAGIQGLKNLLKLVISNNEISQIPENILSPNLGLLNVASNNIVNVTFLRNLTHLQWLDMSSNPLNFIPEGTFLNATAMRKLCVADTNISDTNFLKYVSGELTHLNVSSNSLYHVKTDTIEHLIKLNTLDIAFNKFNEIDFLRPLRGLEKLYAENNSIGAIQPTTFRSLGKLKKLQLSNNNINNEQFMVRLSNVTNLYIRNNKLKSIPNLWDHLPKLCKADFAENQLTSIEFVRGSPSIRVLLLDDNLIADLPGDILQRTHLEFLSLVNNPIQDIAFLCESNLKGFNVSGGAIYSNDQRRMIQSSRIHFESDEDSFLRESLTKCNFENPGNGSLSDSSAFRRCVCPGVAFEIVLTASLVVAFLLVAALLFVVLRTRRRPRRRSPSEQGCIEEDH